MIAHCPLLQRLIVEHCDDFGKLNINAPNLQVVRFRGTSEEVNISNNPNLVDVSIMLDWFGERRGPHRSNGLLKFVAQLPNIHRLLLGFYFTRYLSVGSLPGKFHTPCSHLQFLSVHINPGGVKEMLTVLCLLRMSPALKELNVFIFGNDLEKVKLAEVESWVDENQSCSFTKLRHVAIRGLCAVDNALGLIRFLLISSPALQTMKIHIRRSCGELDPVVGYDLAKKLLRIRRASLNLEIIL